jgi:hypothetical protein
MGRTGRAPESARPTGGAGQGRRGHPTAGQGRKRRERATAGQGGERRERATAGQGKGGGGARGVNGDRGMGCVPGGRQRRGERATAGDCGCPLGGDGVVSGDAQWVATAG